jgi:hypothetical protein
MWFAYTANFIDNAWTYLTTNLMVTMMTIAIWYTIMQELCENSEARNNETWIEIFMIWWNKRRRMKKRGPVRNSPIRYYVYGTKYRMSRALYRRTVPRRKSKCRCTPVLCMITEVNGEVDSTWLGIDTLSTYCMTNDLNDFIGKTKPINEKVTGVSSDHR